MSAKLTKAKRSVSDFSYLPHLDPAFRANPGQLKRKTAVFTTCRLFTVVLMRSP